MATTDVDICNSALFLLGAEEISSLSSSVEAENDRVKVLARVYPPFKEARLTEYPWHWTREKRQLSRDATSPLNEWTYRYLIPAESLRIHAYYDSNQVGARPFRNLNRIGDHVYTDATTLYVDSTEDKSEGDWPRLFEDYFSAALASRIAIAVTGQRSLAEYWHQVAYGLPQEQGEGGLYAKAKAWDTTQTPPTQIQDFSLIEARFGGSGLATDTRLR